MIPQNPELILYQSTVSSTFIAYSPIPNCRGGSNKWKWVEKVGALKNYFLHRAREGGGRCVKTFILVRYKHQYQNIDSNTSKFQFI